MMKKIADFLLISLVSFLTISSLGFLYISQNTYQPTEQALAFSKKAQKETADFLFFESPDKTKATIIFYQGAFVEASSYAEMAVLLTQKGYDVYLLDSFLNLPILSHQKALTLLPNIKQGPIYLAGHSMGGVVASLDAKKSKQIEGLILLASYPSENTDLSRLDLSVLSITSEHDKVLNSNNYREAQELLPPDTTYLTISGGNHAGFGDYGKQKGDGYATISSSKQISKVGDAIDAFIQNN